MSKLKKMKRNLLLLSIISLTCLVSEARDFEYTYEGQTLVYTVIDEESKTCETKSGDRYDAGNNVSGSLVLPGTVSDGETTYALKRISSYAFSGCSGLTSVTIPNSVTEICKGAFNGCSGLKEVHISDLAAWCNIQFESSFSNPLYWGQHLFLNGEEIKDLIIPNSVTEIGSSAFSWCSSLTSVEIGNSVTSIGENAFSECSSLTSVEIPNSVTKIGSYAFRYCSSLTSVTIGNSVTEIGKDAFEDCSELKEVHISDLDAWCNIKFGFLSNPLYYAQHLFLNGEEIKDLIIPNSVTKIGIYAFEGCSSLTSVTIPNSVTKIGIYAFEGCSSLTSVEIPNSVTEIGAGAFSGGSSLTSVNIPKSVTKIREVTFSGCSSLTSVEIPNSVTEIGGGAFSGCSSLTSVNIPNSVKYISDSAFTFCSELTSVTIGNSVAEIGKSAFHGCSLQKVAYPNTITWKYGGWQFAYDPETAEAAADGCVYSKDGKSLLFVPARVTSFNIPEGVTTIRESAFKYCVIESFTIPTTIEKIEADAFDYDSKIERVNFTDWTKWYANVKLENLYSNPYRNGEAYAGGVKIINPELSEGLEEISDYINVGIQFTDEIELPSTLKRIGKYAFYNNKELCSVIMPGKLEEIGESAFEGCELLENPELPSTLLSIEDNAFKGCKLLTEVSLPEGLTNLGNGVFADCSKLEKAVLVADIDTLGENFLENCVALNKVYLPLQLKTIGDKAFYCCNALDEVTLPATLESIGEYAFAIGSISKLNIPNSVKTIGDHAFYRQNISNLTIGSGIESIPEYAFAYNNLKVINFSEGLKEIKENAFANNFAITSVQLPSSVTTIAKNAFSELSISEFVVPDNVTDLPAGSCGNPSVLTIGSGVKTIDVNAFGLNNLHVIRMKANTPPSLSDALNLTDEQNDALTMIVNNGRLSIYQKNARWKQIDNIIEENASDVVIYMTGDYALSEEIRTTTGLMPANVIKMKVIGPLTDMDLRILRENMISLTSLDLSDVTNITSISSGQFNGLLLTDIKLPKSVETIEDNAFSNCSLLQITELPDGITSIGNSAFSNSPRVTISKLPASLTTLGGNAFSGCTGIREITAGEALERIGSEAFRNCTMLETVDLSQSPISEIQSSVFSGCRELDEISLPKSVTSIGEYAFAGTAIRDIAFASAVSSISYYAFSNCRRLVAANLPENVSTVNSQIFAYCPRLIAATMPAGTTYVAANVFNGDNKLANISCAAVEAPEANINAFDGIRVRKVSLTVPVMSFRSYLNAPQWGKFGSIQNKIPVSIDPGVEVSNVAEEEFQEMVKEDQLEAAAEAAAQEPAMIRRRAAARATTYTGQQFASLFDGAQIQTGNDGKGTRIFINPEAGVNVTSVKFNGEEMLSKLDGNSLLLPAGSNGSLEIKTDAVVSIEETDADIDFNAPYQVYNLSGVKVGESLNGLPKGVYIVRQGAKTTKLAI